MKRKFRYEDGGEVDPLEAVNKTENLDTTPGPKAEPEKPKSFSQAFRDARMSGEKTFMWQGKRYGTEMASSKPAPASRPRSQSAPAPAPAPARAQSAATQESSGVPDERARFLARYGTAEQRAKYSRDQMIPQSGIDAAKAAGEERRRKMREQDEAFTESRNRAIKRLLGTQAMRDEANMKTGGRVKGYASGGSVSSRADGCITKGHTKGKMR